MDKCREEFEKHFLSLKFATEGVAQTALDACNFDKDQNVYLPNMEWFLHNDYQEGVVYCSMLNTCYMSFQSLQTEVDELQNLYTQQGINMLKLQKRVDQQGLIIAKAMSIASDLQKSWSMFEIGKKLEQALKGDQYDEHCKKAEEAISEK
ncbi:hypothetical protein QQA06_14445 [Acinetobacter baumannii]|uniref:hypothetical protein n=1 Tax=Acinetobacter baumannii TaxID=470 RepID=UPI00294A913D|nr:hypothetical protein [Acinetobacter baumannii]MDV5203444.1 hypothetical protein [Acinetobacter baumannii]MDV5211373.1 hypothetical protein [Acinetobacter baumannii]MDV5261582.1 hypothetical protein [Acinetobacter baumannii]MDV5272635.1 hypothetical protein [Acinetobacter baumannii]